MASGTSPRTANQASSLQQQLAAWLGRPVALAITSNRSTMLSWRRTATCLKLRLHEMFPDAPEPVLRAVLDYSSGRREAEAAVDNYIRENMERINHAPGAGLVAAGAAYDLQAPFEKLNREHFGGSIQARIGWARRARRWHGRSIRLGVYDHQRREIRIHPALDNPGVPLFFLESIILHEMLHHLFPVAKDGRRAHHPPEFRARERAFPLYEQALQWEREHLWRVLREDGTSSRPGVAGRVTGASAPPRPCGT